MHQTSPSFCWSSTLSRPHTCPRAPIFSCLTWANGLRSALSHRIMSSSSLRWPWLQRKAAKIVLLALWSVPPRHVNASSWIPKRYWVLYWSSNFSLSGYWKPYHSLNDKILFFLILAHLPKLLPRSLLIPLPRLLISCLLQRLHITLYLQSPERIPSNPRVETADIEYSLNFSAAFFIFRISFRSWMLVKPFLCLWLPFFSRFWVGKGVLFYYWFEGLLGRLADACDCS